jgi:hypothetical protein
VSTIELAPSAGTSEFDATYGSRVPAETVAANAPGATAVARSEARSAALVATLIAFFQIVK